MQSFEAKVYGFVVVFVAFLLGLYLGVRTGPKYAAYLQKGGSTPDQRIAILTSDDYDDLPMFNCKELANIANQSWNTDSYFCVSK